MPRLTKSQQAEYQARIDAIINALRDGEMTKTQIESKVGFKLQPMVMAGLVRREMVNSRNGIRRKGYDFERIYSIGKAEYSDEVPLLCNIWPVPVPAADGRPKLIKLTDEVHNGRALSCALEVGMQSSMG